MENKISKEEIKKLQEAIYNTASVYSTRQAKFALKSFILNNGSDYFTRTNNARNDIKEIGIEKVKDIAITKYIDFIINHPSPYENPLEEAVRRTYFKYKNDPAVDENKLIKDLLKNCLEKEKNTFTRDLDARANLNDYLSRNNIKLSEFVAKSISGIVTEDLILEKLENIVEKNELKVSNVETHPENLNQLRSAIMSGAKGFQREGTISIGQELTACSSIGKIRKNQEDAVLLIQHPQNPDFKMMIVADGMGGGEAGEEASNILVNEMKNWFETLDVSYFNNMSGLDYNLNQALQITSDLIYQKFAGRAGTTFVGAIVGKDNTLISNVGDSRGYILKGKDLIQVTEDHSLVQGLYNIGVIKDKDDMRFHKRSNMITQSIGIGDILEPSSQILQNSRYDSIILTSDGVTDCLSDNKLLAITKNTDKRKLSEVLVQEALNTNSFRTENLSSSEYKDVIYGGKDNATVAVYNKDDLSESGREKSNSQKNWRKDDDGTNNSANKLKDAIEIEIEIEY